MTANGQLADNKYLLNSNSSIGSIAFTSTAAGAHTFNIDNVQIYTPAGLAINGPNPVFIPAADSSTFLYSSAYTSDTGTVDNSPSVTWTTIPAEIDGVSIDANGMLSVDSTALPGSFTVQAVLASDSSVISSKTVTLSASSDATTNYMAFSYSKTNPSSNIPISVTPNGNTLVSVLYGGTTLDPVTDYTFENNKLTLSPDYLNSFPSGSYINLKLHMSGGADPTLIVSVIDPNEQPQTATISNASALVDTLAKLR
jgi:hypothetical protein